MPNAIARCVLPVPGRAESHDALLGVQEVELAEVLDHRLLDAALEGEVELLKRFSRREAGLADPCLAAETVAGGHLGLQQRLHEPLVAPLLRPGAVGQLRQRSGGRRRLERSEQVRELGLLSHLRRVRNPVEHRQIADLDVLARRRLAGLASQPQPLERCLVGGVGELLSRGEHTPMLGGQLAGIERDRDDLMLRDAHLDAPADQPWIQRVVVAVDVHVWLWRHPDDDPTVEIRTRFGQRPHAFPLAIQPIDRPLAKRAVQAHVRAL